MSVLFNSNNPNHISLEEAKELIAELKEIDFERCSKNQIEDLIAQLKQHAAVIHTLPAGTVICRSISCNFLGGQYPVYVSQISYNPNLDQCPFNRASWEKETAFYGCVTSEILQSYNTSQMEIIGDLEKKTDHIAQELFVTGKWILQKDLHLVLLSGNLKNSVKITESRNGTLYDFIIRDKENLLTLKLIDSFLCEEFSKAVENNEKWKYKISASYSNLIKNDNWPGLLYPSVRSIGAGMNIAIFPKIVDDGIIKLERAAGIIYYKRGDKMVNEYVMEAIPDDNVLRWKETYNHKLPPKMKAYYTGRSDDDSFEQFIPYQDLN